MRRLGEDDGAAAVEFGLLLPLLVMLVFGIIEFSTAYNRAQGMQAGVREGARYASTGDRDPADVRAHVWNALQENNGGSGFLDPTDVRIEMYDAPLDLSTYDDLDLLPAGTDDPCDGSSDEVQVVAWIDGSRRAPYELTLVFFPSVELDFRSEAIFPCLE